MPIVPNQVLKNLKCVNCQYWLSYGPIRLLPNGGSICGRCHYVGPRDQYRHFAFEALACYFKFPCINWENHCDEFVLFKKVSEHEKKCKFGSTCRLLCSHPSKACKSPRRLNLNATVKLETTPDEVLEYLRCSNCAGYLSCSPVYVCRDGTSLCHRCTSQIPEPDGEFIRDWCFEVFVKIMIFPCIFRYRGCPEVYQYGEEMMEHEYDCPYGKTYIREPRPVKSENPQEKSHKEKGVIKTITGGHIYATITPNAPLFSLSSVPNNNAKQGMFSDEFDRYRENLASKWGHGQYSQQYLEDDRVPAPTSLIEELKSRQQMKESFRSQNKQDNNYYNQQDRQYGNQELQRIDSFEEYDRKFGRGYEPQRISAQHNSYYNGNPEPHRANSFAQHDRQHMAYINRDQEPQRTNYSVYPSNRH